MVEPVRKIATERELAELAIGYVFHERAAKDLAADVGVSAKTVVRRLVDFGVHIRSSAEQRICDRRRGRYSHSKAIRGAWSRGAYDGYDRHGERNPFFGKRHSDETRAQLAGLARSRLIAGIGEYGDDWTEQLRGRIVDRDGRRCQVCSATNCMLQVHHVDLDRTNNGESNLLTLCAACHLAYHGRAELQDEIRAAHRALLARLGLRPTDAADGDAA